MDIDCCALIGLVSYTELRELVSGSHIIVSGLMLLKCKNNEPETNFTHFLHCDYVYDKRPAVSLKYSWAFVHWSPNLLWGF